MDQQTNRLEPLEPGTYVIAVSGGVDSIVLLDMLSNQKDIKFVVAHFDHGIRDDSHEDAIFVEERARHYGFPFESLREELGRQASEETARTRRYEFLWNVASKHDARLITAHHADDVIETITINFKRGTGWRGLAVLDSKVVRPLLPFFKADLLAYAKKHDLEWHEDSTNKSEAYLRNRIRAQLVDLAVDSKLQLLGLWSEQKQVKRQIDREVEKLQAEEESQARYFYMHLDEATALEILRPIFDGRLTRPQLRAVWLAIKTAKAGASMQPGGNVSIDFTSRNFNVKLLK
jgi:tRNA(Ile)-lysidine synthetase-like protein